MAYFLKTNNEEENQNQGQAQNSGGNIYSTSQSEVSSVSDSASSGNSNNANTESNKSGNWVNLDKYLDANRGKVGGYVDNLVKPYTDSATQFKQDSDASKQSYTQQVNDNTLSKDEANSIIGKYVTDGSSITDDQYNKVSNAVRGKFGVDSYETTDDYNNLKNQATDLGEVGSNLNDWNFIQSLMGNNVSSGGKALNNFLVSGTQQGRDAIASKNNEFSALASLLDNQAKELNDLRDRNASQSASNVQEVYNGLKDNAQYQKLVSNVFNTNLAGLLNQYGYDKYNPNNVNNRAYYGDMLPKTSNSITLADGTTLSIPSLERAMRTGNQSGEYSEALDRLNSLETGSGRLDSKVDSQFKYDNNQWAGIVDRSNNIERIVQNPNGMLENNISSMIREALAPEQYPDLFEYAYDPQRAQYRANVQAIYRDYLEGYYDQFVDPTGRNGHRDPLAYLYADLSSVRNTGSRRY